MHPFASAKIPGDDTPDRDHANFRRHFPSGTPTAADAIGQRGFPMESRILL
jgi:hypothetical protein